MKVKTFTTVFYLVFPTVVVAVTMGVIVGAVWHGPTGVSMATAPKVPAQESVVQPLSSPLELQPTSPSTQRAGWMTYRNDEFRFQLDYPAGGRILQWGNDRIDILGTTSQGGGEGIKIDFHRGADFDSVVSNRVCTAGSTVFAIVVEPVMLDGHEARRITIGDDTAFDSRIYIIRSASGTGSGGDFSTLLLETLGNINNENDTILSSFRFY